MSFKSVMTKIGQDFKIVWTDVVKYLPSASALAALIFPEAAAVPAVVDAVNLIQQAVATVEQKFAAAGNLNGTGLEKSAQVLSIVGPVVTQLLASENIVADPAYIEKIITDVCDVLNTQPAQVAPVAATTAS